MTMRYTFEKRALFIIAVTSGFRSHIAMEDVTQGMLGIPVETHDMGHLFFPQRDLHRVGLFLQEIARTGKQERLREGGGQPALHVHHARFSRILSLVADIVFL